MPRNEPTEMAVMQNKVEQARKLLAEVVAWLHEQQRAAPPPKPAYVFHPTKFHAYKLKNHLDGLIKQEIQEP